MDHSAAASRRIRGVHADVSTTYRRPSNASGTGVLSARQVDRRPRRTPAPPNRGARRANRDRRGRANGDPAARARPPRAGRHGRRGRVRPSPQERIRPTEAPARGREHRQAPDPSLQRFLGASLASTIRIPVLPEGAAPDQPAGAPRPAFTLPTTAGRGQPCSRRGGRVAEGTRLLSEYGGHTPSRVRIPPSPLNEAPLVSRRRTCCRS